MLQEDFAAMMPFLSLSLRLEVFFNQSNYYGYYGLFL
jgi:hypothetical protein